jgi:hypothetical protein
MSITYSDISFLLSEAKKKKPLTTGDCDAPKVDDSIAKITEGSFDIGPGHRGAMKGSKIYNKGKSTTNPNEKDAFLKKSGAQLPPLAQKKPSTQMAGYQPEGELIEFVGGKPGDGYIGHPNLDIKNPFAKKQTKEPTGNKSLVGKLGDRKMRIDKMTNQMLNQSFDPEGEIFEKEYQVGDTIDNSDDVKAYQKRRMDTLQRMIKGDPKKWDFSQQNVNKRMVTGESVELDEGSAAWQKSAGKNKSGGLNEKGRKSYERENPGSDLKAPSKKKGNKRRASFCARMKGMRKRQKPSNNTGEDRLSKSLRAWNC